MFLAELKQFIFCPHSSVSITNLYDLRICSLCYVTCSVFVYVLTQLLTHVVSVLDIARCITKHTDNTLCGQYYFSVALMCSKIN